MPPVTLHQREFGDPKRVFTFQKIPPTKAVRVLVPVGRFLAGPLALAARAAGIAPDPKAMQKAAEGLAAGAPAGKVQDEKEWDLASEALTAFFAGLDAEELVKVQVVVFGSVLCDGKPILGEEGINATFADSLEDMAKVFWEGMVYNFGPFLRGRLSGSLGAVAGKLNL